jgi:hypothetical protein
VRRRTQERRGTSRARGLIKSGLFCNKIITGRNYREGIHAICYSEAIRATSTARSSPHLTLSRKTFHVRPFVSATENEDSACVCSVRAGAPVFLESFQLALGRGSLRSQREGLSIVAGECVADRRFVGLDFKMGGDVWSSAQTSPFISG